MKTPAYDVAIIGNAALGLSTAYQLNKADKNLKIGVIGPADRPFSATTTAGAMINVWAEIGYDHFGFPALSDKVELGLRAFDMWDPLCAELSEFSEKPLKVVWGTYVVNNARSSGLETKTLDYIVKVMQSGKIPHKDFITDPIPWFNPQYGSQATRIVHMPDGRIDARLVLAAYDRALAAKGVVPIRSRAVKVDLDITQAQTQGKGSAKITLASGEAVEAKHVVFANGSFAQELIDQIPAIRMHTPRLLWGAGAAVDLTFPEWIQKGGGLDKRIFDMDQVLRTVDRGGSCGVHMVPQGGGAYYLGASSGVWFDPEWAPRLHGIHFLLHAAMQEINPAFFYANMTIRGPGFRPTTADCFPLLGESHIKGVWFANGTKRDGFTCSPFLATELALGILGKRHRLPYRFRPSRPLLSYKNKALAVEDSLNAAMGGEYQHGLSLPAYALEPYQASKRAKIQEIYDKRKLNDFGIHPEITHIYENDDTFAAIDLPREM
ncbi:MAG: FAD-binding oxidoreductase [Proteobacteria bacterium]|nr:FAD-binding oxidoreductase [Pseudomonadota bacterium]